MLSVGNSMGIPYSIWEHIKAETSSEVEKKRRIADYYVKSTPHPSWKDLAHCLYHQDEKRAVEAVRKYCHGPRGTEVMVTE